MSGFGYDTHGIAIGHLVAAMGAARSGDHSKAATHLENANKFATAHAKILQSQGQKEEAIRYMDSFRNHANTIKQVSAEKQIKDTKKSELCKVCKDEVCKCEKFEKVDKTPQKAGQVKGQSEYDYKMIHELHPEDQMRAQRFFNAKDVGRFKYPVDKASGRIVHGQRVPLAAGEKPSDPHSYQQTPAHLREGASVRINAPGTKFHGRFGMVSSHVPSGGGKTAVHIGNMTSAPIHFPHAMVQPSKPTTSVEKAIITLNNIRKVFLK